MENKRKKRTKIRKKKKYIKAYFADGDLLYGSGKDLNRQIAYKRAKLVNSIRNKLASEFMEAGLSCINVIIIRGTRIMFNVHGKWFLPYYSYGVPKCPDHLRGCKEWSEKCIFSVLNDKDMKTFNKIMKKVERDRLLFPHKQGAVDAHM